MSAPKILVAEDEPHIARIMKHILVKAGYDVEHAANGLLAQAAIQRSHPDLLITDISMPKMTGRELCAWIKAALPDRKFHIIVLTSLTELEHREWSANMDKLMFLEKPVSAKKLLPMLEEYFSRESDG